MMMENAAGPNDSYPQEEGDFDPIPGAYGDDDEV